MPTDNDYRQLIKENVIPGYHLYHVVRNFTDAKTYFRGLIRGDYLLEGSPDDVRHLGYMVWRTKPALLADHDAHAVQMHGISVQVRGKHKLDRLHLVRSCYEAGYDRPADGVSWMSWLTNRVALVVLETQS